MLVGPAKCQFAKFANLQIRKPGLCIVRCAFSPPRHRSSYLKTVGRGLLAQALQTSCSHAHSGYQLYGSKRLRHMADNFYVVQAPAVEDSPDVEFAQLSRVAFVKKLGKRAQLRAVDGQIHMFLRAPQTIQQMRTAVSGKLKAQGYDARVSQVSAEEFARQLAAADHAAATPEACPDEGAAPGAPSTTTGTVARRTPLQAVLDLLPSLPRLERNAVLFKIVATDAALIDCREQALLKTKEEMAKIVLEHAIAEWGGMLAPFVQEAHRQDPKMGRHRDATLDGLGLLLGYPPHSRGYKRTRATAPTRQSGSWTCGSGCSQLRPVSPSDSQRRHRPMPPRISSSTLS